MRSFVMQAGCWLVAAALCVAVGCGGQASAGSAPGSGETGASPGEQSAAPVLVAPVLVARAERRDMPLWLRAIGTVESPASVTLKPQLDGRVVDVCFNEGEDVHADDVLVLLDQRPAQAALQLAEANLARDRALAQDASLAAEQYESVRDSGDVSARLVQQARANAEATRATVGADEAQLEAARLRLDYCTVRAPFDGRTGLLGVRVGSVVKAGETELVTLNQVAPIRVALSVPQDRLAAIVARQAEAPLPVHVTLADGGHASGLLTFIDNAVDRATGTISLRAEFPNDDRRLWPGQYVQAALEVGVDRDAVVVPARAVQTGQQGSYVFVVREDRSVELREVEPARTADDLTVIASGLDGGETVVTDGQLRLVDGALVSFDG